MSDAMQIVKKIESETSYAELAKMLRGFLLNPETMPEKGARRMIADCFIASAHTLGEKDGKKKFVALNLRQLANELEGKKP